MSNLQKRKENLLFISNKPIQLFVKRLFDIMFSFIALLVLSPLFCIIAIIIFKEDGKPIFFKQERSGKNNMNFGMYKFRSMRVQQKKYSKKNAYTWKDGVPDDFVFKASSENNPNITKTGLFIRKYSLDELPQFYNVLKGDMSIIGPRPEIIEITRCYTSEQRQRLYVKPGITGYAQANGRSNMDHGTKIKLDLYYVKHFSLLLDIKIFIKTIGQVLTGKGSV